MSFIQESLNRVDQKKQKLDSLRPLPTALIKNLDEWFAIELTYTSNAIEGNTLSMSETALVVEKGITIGGKTIREHLEAINHAQAIDFIINLAKTARAEITLDDILAIHKLILQKIDDMNAGILRKQMVRVMGSSTIFPNPAKVPFLMIEFMEWLQNANDHPILIAALAHYKLVTIHPFIDGPPTQSINVNASMHYELWRTQPAEASAKEGNGRTARLLMNLLLLQHGYPFAIIKKEKRSSYIAAIEHARTNDDMTPFYEIIIEAVEYVLDNYLQAAEQSIP